ERLHRPHELEVLADLLGVPETRVDAVRHVNRAETQALVRGGARLGGGCGNHRVEQRQGEDGARTAQECSTIQVLLGDKHAYSCATVSPDARLLSRIWNG